MGGQGESESGKIIIQQPINVNGLDALKGMEESFCNWKGSNEDY